MSRINFFENLSNPISKAVIADSVRFSDNSEFFNWLREKTSSQNFIAFSLVVMLHITALFGMMINFHNNQALPTVSFTVTMLDVSATSSNVVSSSASVASHSESAAKSDSKDKAAATKLAAATKEVEQNNETKNKSSQSHNSVQQTAVVAPTTPALFDAAYLNNPAPVYPALSRRLGEQGTVLLDVYVDENGKAQNVAVKKSSGFEMLDNAALETVKKWRFSAAKQGEKLVASSVQVPVKFVLEK